MTLRSGGFKAQGDRGSVGPRVQAHGFRGSRSAAIQQLTQFDAHVGARVDACTATEQGEIARVEVITGPVRAVPWSD
jgi:hypothetical protein